MGQLREQEEVNMNLGVLWMTLRGHLGWILLAGILLCLGSLLAVRLFVPAQYESVTKLYVIGKQSGAEDVTYNDLEAGSQLAKDYMELVKSRPVVEGVIAENDLGLSYGQLIQKIRVSAPTDTRILEIAVTDANPMEARRIAEGLKEAVIRQIQTVMDVSGVNISEQPNLPEEPVSPDLKKLAALTLIGGWALAFLGALVYILLDDKVKSSEDVRRYLDLSLLGMIPLKESGAQSTGKGGSYGKRRGKAMARTRLPVK